MSRPHPALQLAITQVRVWRDKAGGEQIHRQFGVSFAERGEDYCYVLPWTKIRGACGNFTCLGLYESGWLNLQYPPTQPKLFYK